MDVMKILGRLGPLFAADMQEQAVSIAEIVRRSKILVLGGAGTIGSAVTRELFKRDPEVLHIVDINENGIVELVREIRSQLGYGRGAFDTFAIDCGSRIFTRMAEEFGSYDYVFNLSAMKHVRSEKDAYTLMRMIEVNILNTLSTVKTAKNVRAKKYFSVSTDKATNPVNLMGATKHIMELFLMRESGSIPVSTARFANVAFSDGSLLHGFNQRLQKGQPISAPHDVARYFITQQEAGELCLLSALIGDNRDIFVPKLTSDFKLTKFTDVAARYLEEQGYDAFECQSEEEARRRVKELGARKKWPVYFFETDTTGEKLYEEFTSDTDDVDGSKFKSIDIVKNLRKLDYGKLNDFESNLLDYIAKETWTKSEIVSMFQDLMPFFHHEEKNKNLNDRM